jgi:hypothetical protein
MYWNQIQATTSTFPTVLMTPISYTTVIGGQLTTYIKSLQEMALSGPSMMSQDQNFPQSNPLGGENGQI